MIFQVIQKANVSAKAVKSAARKELLSMATYIIIWILASSCIGLLWSMVGVMERNQRLENKIHDLELKLSEIEDQRDYFEVGHVQNFERLKAKLEFEENCG